jgi:uncharacterized protein
MAPPAPRPAAQPPHTAMFQLLNSTPGKFCWLDLAARDAPRATRFYEAMFGWSAHAHAANGGSFHRLAHRGQDVGSLYQLSAAQIERGAGSHWTPYVGVADLDDAVERAAAAGGAIIVPPFVVAGVARIALIEDAVGAHLGLWAPLEK